MEIRRLLRAHSLAVVATGVAALALLGPGPAAAQAGDGEGDARGVKEVRDCIERNVPAKTSEQLIEFTSVDRVGGERVSRAKVIGKRFDDGLRRLLLRFTYQ